MTCREHVNPQSVSSETLLVLPVSRPLCSHEPYHMDLIPTVNSFSAQLNPTDFIVTLVSTLVFTIVSSL